MKHIHYVITLGLNVNGEETEAVVLSTHANTTAVKAVSSSAMEEIELRLCDFLDVSGPAVDTLRDYWSGIAVSCHIAYYSNVTAHTCEILEQIRLGPGFQWSREIR